MSTKTWILLIFLLFFLVFSSSATTIVDYAAKIQDEPNEHMYVFDPFGAMMFHNEGNSTCVYVSSLQASNMEGKISIHNHPNGDWRPSEQDFEMHKKTKSFQTWVVTNTTVTVIRFDCSTVEYEWVSGVLYWKHF